ncbi:MAG: 4-(cytidine 5'-diphospho)-2-C-methyl-D-erythritol kinase [Planctomycetota bacterium]|jgi:4-diphosphocytidyl-2-C-methyl-D-erythritol kinase
MADSIALQAPAKLNLALSVGPPDDDGMHPICTWMVTVDLCDELLVTRLADDRLSRYAILWHADAQRPSDIDWAMTRDLAVRAHLALEQRTNRRLPVQMKLEKRIPVGGGLGGGSSDAAAMLRATNELFGLDLSVDDLREVAAGLGSDVPFFVSGGSAIVEGFGERIEPHDVIRPLHAVIVFPEASCPTGHVYAMYDEIGPRPLRPDAVRALAAGQGALRTDAVFNDLSDAAVRLSPALQDPASELSRLAECPAQVAGSGSSLFVLCDDELHASALADTVNRQLDLPAAAVRSAPVPEPTTIASP